jgi:hypothetical protein
LVATDSASVEMAVRQPQMAALRKHVGVDMMHIKLGLLLTDALAMLPHELGAPHMKLYAAQILADFHYLRFEEIAYVLRQGINGRYGRLYGKFVYTTLTEWISLYETGERAEYEKKRAAERQGQAAEGLKDFFDRNGEGLIGVLQKMQDAAKRHEQGYGDFKPGDTKIPDQNYFDEQLLDAINKRGGESSDDELRMTLKYAEQGGYAKSADAIRELVAHRAHSEAQIQNEIHSLAKRIIGGEKIVDAESLQLQANYPERLEAEIKRQTQEPKEC